MFRHLNVHHPGLEMGVMTTHAEASAATLPAPGLNVSARAVTVPAVVALAAFAALLLIVGPRHEAWFDEAQAWLVGRDVSLWTLLTERLPYEGTPALWHGLLWLLSHAGMPFSWLWAVSAAFACAGAWIILTRAPFPFWLRVGVIFSYFVAYQYAIVARSYALDLLLIPLLAATFADRLRRPVLYGVLLGLCANINVHSLVIAAVLSAEFVVAAWRSGAWRRAHVLGGTISLLLGCLAARQAFPPPDSSFADATFLMGERGQLMIAEAFIDRLDILSQLPPSDNTLTLGALVSLVLLAPTIMLVTRAGVSLVVCALFAGLIGFSVVKYANAWHGGLLFLVWIFALWIGWGMLRELSSAERRLVIGSVALIVFVNVFYTGCAALRDIREPYSAGPAAAKHLVHDTPIAAAGFKTFAVQPWFDANLFQNYHHGTPLVAYYTWRKGTTFRPDSTLEFWRALVAEGRYGSLLLSNHTLGPDLLGQYLAVAREAGYCKSAEFPGGLIWKSYVRESDGLIIFRRCGDAAQSHAGSNGDLVR